MCQTLDDGNQSNTEKIVANQFLSSLFTSLKRFCYSSVDYLALTKSGAGPQQQKTKATLDFHLILKGDVTQLHS